MNRSRPIPLLLSAACYALALAQRPGDVVADTKVDLYVDPRGFLAEVASAWTTQGQLGHVFGGQYGGYLFPMAPWFALGDLLGVPVWIVHRLWLGTLLALAAWGVVRLLDALMDRPRGVPHVVAAVVFVLNPYVAVYANRTSIALLAYAALPWTLLYVHRGLREPRSWRWPAALALVLTCTGGGVNLAVTGWVLLGPVLFVVYERTLGGVGRGAVPAFTLRLAPVALAANAWWLAPALVHARYGLDFLPFTEQPGTIWQTTSVPESLRLMGFWTSYIGLGFGGELRPFASHAPALLFHPLVVVASLLIPALALGGLAWTRRWRYGPWFALLALAGLAVMACGFPEGTPLRRAATFAYNHLEPLRFLRTTYKAGPLLALGLAALGGALVGVAWDRAARLRRATAWRGALAAATVGVCALAAWPLASGTAPERQLVFDVPDWWARTAEAVDRLPEGKRAMVLPGRLFAYYDWGGTIDPILPALAERPVAERMIVPYADLRAVDLQITTDALVSQERALPGQLSPLLRLMGVGAIVSTADDDRSRSGAVGPVEAADVLDRQAGLGAPSGIGARRREHAAAGRIRRGERLPRVTLRRVRGSAGDAAVRVLPRGPLTVVDGSAEALASMAAFGVLDPARPLAYAADLDANRIREAAAAGGAVVVSDSNRRQAFVAARMRANRGAVLTAWQSLSEDGAMLDPFGRGPDAQTVALLEGIAEVTAPASPQTPQTPEHRPYAALDGDPATAWIADRALAKDRHWLEVRFAVPRDVGVVEILPYGDERGRPLVLDVGGRRVRLRDGWNRVAVDRRGLRSLRVRIVEATQPVGGTGGTGGIAELRIPGVRARELLRPPVLVERALAGRPVRGPLTYLLSRVTTDAPARTAPPVGPFQTHLLRDRVDPEPRLVRSIAPPVARDWTVDAWTAPAPAASDAALDRLAGTTGTVRATSSGREGGLAAHRASRAFDGDRASAWIAPWVDGGLGGARPAASLTFALERPATLRRLRLVPSNEAVRRPTRVRVRAGGNGGAHVDGGGAARGSSGGAGGGGGAHVGGGGAARRSSGGAGAPAVSDGGTAAGRRAGATAAVGRSGEVELPRALRGRVFTIEVVAARFPPGTAGVERQRRAVGIAEIEGVPGARVRTAPGGAPVRGRCGDARVRTAAGLVALKPAGTVAELEDGQPLRARACGGPVRLRARRQEVAGADGVLQVDHLRLRSVPGDGARDADDGSPAGAHPADGGGEDGARAGLAEAPGAPGAGRVLDQGDGGRGSRDGVRVEVDRPGWLVLGESYNAGWRATCDGRDLGEPVPMQGFANAWPVEPGCRNVAFTWTPNTWLGPAYLISLVACAVLLVLLAVTAPRRRSDAPVARPILPDDAPVRRWPWRPAIVAGLAAGVALGFVFAIRAGVVIAPAVALILRYGVPARTLALAGGALLGVVVPLLYLAVPVDDPGGYNSNLAVDLIAAHWVAVAAVVLIGAALWRTLAAARRRAP